MNLNAIKSNCMRTRKFIVMNSEDGSQWISNGQAAWIMEGVRISTNNVPGLFNLSEKQESKCLILDAQTDDPRYHETGTLTMETLCTDVGEVIYNGWIFRALMWKDKLLFILKNNLKPTSNGLDDAAFNRYEARALDGDVKVAVYGGLLCEAILDPMPDAIAEKIQEEAMKIARQELYRLGPCDDGEQAADEIAEQMSI